MSKVSRSLVTTEALILWPNLFKTRIPKYKDGSTGFPIFDCQLLLDKAGAAKVKATIDEIIAEAFPGLDATDVKIKNALQAGDKEAARLQAKGSPHADLYRGWFVVSPKTGENSPPQVIHTDGTDVLPNKIWGGCVVRAEIGLSSYDNQGQGVTSYLNSVLLIQTEGNHPVFGELKRLGGGPRSAKDAFADYMGQERSSDPSAGSEDDLLGGL